VGVVIPSYGRYGDPAVVLRLVAVAERLGYDGAWFADHLALPDYATAWVPPPVLEPLAACAVGLGTTTRLRFGTDVLVAPYRHPVALASSAASIHALGGGRLVLGLGVGYLQGEFAALGVDYAERGAITDDALDVLRSLFTGESVTLHPASGRFPLEAVRAGVVGGIGGPPLWVGGNAPVARRRAAVRGDGWHPLWPTPDAYRAGRQEIEQARADAAIDRPFTFSMSCPRGAVLDAPRDWSEDATAAGRARAAGPSRPEFGYVPVIPRTERGRPRFTGTPDELGEDLEAYAAAGVEHLVVRFWTSALDLAEDALVAQMTRFATEVMPGA
jgi:probable F420-dependent oxidoreductase